METVEEFAETNTGRTCKFIHRDFMSREGVYTGKIVGYYKSTYSNWILVEPDVNIGEMVSKTYGDGYYHWRYHCERYVLAALETITIDPKKKNEETPFPHRCHCGQPAFIIFQFIECSSVKCKNYKKRFG